MLGSNWLSKSQKHRSGKTVGPTGSLSTRTRSVRVRARACVCVSQREREGERKRERVFHQALTPGDRAKMYISKQWLKTKKMASLLFDSGAKVKTSFGSWCHKQSFGAVVEV